jgi:molybdenum cofactor cytidylyltransferase
VPNDAKTGIAAVVLAAGSSRRMGRNKLLLDLGGQSVLRTAARAAVDAGLQPVTVVLGHEAERVAAELAGLPCRTVVNPDHLRGVATSLHAGVKSLPPESSALVVVLGDMPFVTAAMIRSLVERYQATGARVVVSRYGDVEAPPTLFDRSVFPELLSVGGDRCARVVARRHESEGAVMAWPAGALRDLDVADDYAQARAALRES